jgi:hypothetical protein
MIACGLKLVGMLSVEIWGKQLRNKVVDFVG